MSINLSSEKPISQSGQKFGTFLGVFTPSLLTILGLIMYLRFGWVVGNIGLPFTILIVLMSTSITFITALSASAVATNRRVGVGGEYYMISRSLGPELGGAIGIPLFLCRTLSITFYSFGLAESIISFWPNSDNTDILILTAVIIIFITAVSSRSASLVLKMQIPIMITVGISLLALAVGVFSYGLHMPELTATYRTAPKGFWYVFAVFFPAVTGFTAGIGMSGDLKDPQRSIPKGTLLSVVTGACTYIIVLILLSISARISYEELAEPGIAWTKVAVLGAWLVYPGLWGAILSSSFGSVLGGPRVLQSLAKDGLAPKFFSRLSKTGQPTIATWVTGAIALVAVTLGGLNSVAQFVTILFLTLYVVINFSAALEKLVGNPSYRPTINVPWYLSLLGSCGAIVVMFLINPYACIVTIVLELILYLFLQRRSLQHQWGDVRAGLWIALTRFTLLQLHRYESNPRNWRPHFLLFAGDAAKRIELVRLAAWFNQNNGIVTVCQLIEGDLKNGKIETDFKHKKIDRVLNEEGLVAFSEVDVVSDFENGVIDIAQSKGIADLKCNAVMFGWPSKQERLESILRILHGLSNTGISTIISRLKWEQIPNQKKQIDIWWRGKQRNGDLMLLLAHLLCLNEEWKYARIVIRSIVENESEMDEVTSSLASLIPETRIKADTEVIVKPSNSTTIDIMHNYSKNADIVFLGLNDPEPGSESEYAQWLNKMISGFKTTIFVRNASEFAGDLI
ncbi:MAG: amino acid permease [Spirochaetota bacterium]|nr:amino acid permease [Spirochaetota bacterium]